MAAAGGSSVSNRSFSHSAEVVLPECLFLHELTNQDVCHKVFERMLFFLSYPHRLERHTMAQLEIFFSYLCGVMVVFQAPRFELLPLKRDWGMTQNGKRCCIFHYLLTNSMTVG